MTVSKMGGGRGKEVKKNRNRAHPFTPTPCPGDPSLLMGGQEEPNALCRVSFRFSMSREREARKILGEREGGGEQAQSMGWRGRQAEEGSDLL